MNNEIVHIFLRVLGFEWGSNEDLKFKTRHLHDSRKARKLDFIITRYIAKFLMLLLYI